MTELNRLFRAGVFAGSLSLAALSVATAAAQAPSQMPRPRYQSPGVPQVEAPRPQYSLPPATAITPNATVVEDVIVRVNDQIISRSDLERSEEQLQQEVAGSKGQVDAADRQKNLLRDLIDQQLLLSKGKELSINPDAEVVRRLDEIRKQNNFPTMEALEAAARSQGVSFEDFKASIRNSIITSSVVRDEVGRTIHMSNADQQKYYEAHKADFDQPEQVRLSEILVPTAADADDAAIAAAQKTSQDLYAKLQGGADFAAVAKQSSGGPTAAQGGDLGLFKHGALAAVLEQKTFALPVGGYTEPTRTRQGFVILKATEHQKAGTPPFEQVQPDVQNAMYQEAIQPALRAYLTRLREESYVDIRPGFVDSGASPRQTKPVFAAYVAPTPKKAKQQKKRMDIAATGRLATAKTAAVTPAVTELDKHGKPKKAQREKIRFGQAPRTALPDAPESLDANGTAAAAAVAPGTSISPLETNSNTVAANVAAADDTEAAPAKPRAKTRYASREVEVKQKKETVKLKKVAEKVKATPIAAGSEEKATAKAQADALGLNGSDAVKKKKKRKKGEAKDRLQTKPVEPAAPLQDNGLPDRLHQVNGPQKSSDSTTLPPATQPAPGSAAPSTTPPASGTPAPPPQQ
jgi:peptidyl-prolyl cis-trans isomerase SurA